MGSTFSRYRRAPLRTRRRKLTCACVICMSYLSMTRTERLFALAEYLRGRRSGVTAAELAARFSIAVRTVHRDLSALKVADLPISSERGRGGGFALDAHYALPPINISAREAAVLLSLLQYAKEQRLMPFAESLQAATEKVRAALSASGQRELTRRLNTLAFIGVPAKLIDPKVARLVEQAWFEGSMLELDYETHHGHLSRVHCTIVRCIFDRSETQIQARMHDGSSQNLRLHRLRLPSRTARAEPTHAPSQRDKVATGARASKLTRAVRERIRDREKQAFARLTRKSK
jgi:predicted DNA-binding transcriptional regulator YafY